MSNTKMDIVPSYSVGANKGLRSFFVLQLFYSVSTVKKNGVKS